MRSEILMVGSELLLGQILDTNAGLMARALAENGINLFLKTTVGDNRDRIVLAMAEALSRSDVILVSGGLGPTEDDLTREAVADLLDRPLEFRQELFDGLAARLARFQAPITGNNRKQAMAPRGAIVIENPHGTAPGLIIEDARGTIICMPGVPWELEPMLMECVIPYLRRRFDIKAAIHSRVLKVCGIGESRVDDAMGDLMKTLSNPTIGVLASPDAVRIRICARADSAQEAEAMIDPVDQQIRDRLPNLILREDETPEGVVDSLLIRHNWTLSLTEAGTGGMLAHRYTIHDPGAFALGIVIPAPVPESDLHKFARTLATDTPVKSESACIIALAADAAKETAVAVFLGPGIDEEWEFPFLTGNERARIRLATTVFERVRRKLLQQ